MRGVTVRIMKDSAGRIEKVVFDWEGYRGGACDRKALELYENLRSLGIEIKEKHKEYKPEFYLQEEEEHLEVNEFGL